MLAELLIELKLAVPNPSFDENKPYTERLKIIKPGRIASMDESRLTNDTMEKIKSKGNRSIIGKSETREVLANKGGGDGTGIRGSTADGVDMPGFLIFAENIIYADDVKFMSVCRRMDAEREELFPPWEIIFSQAKTLKAWKDIGVNPCTQKVYWDLLEQKRVREEVAAKAQVDPELMTVQGMVKIMFGMDGTERENAANQSGDEQRKRSRDTLDSCDLDDVDLLWKACNDDAFRHVAPFSP
ncbi:MAG: hypothetical protein SGPRY_003681 [Prymnesium sp.]